MRERLLSATVDSLCELGYARTTTVEIAKRAGVSRGAQLHHFPTKQALVLEAVQYLTDIRHLEFRALMKEIPNDENRTSTGLDLAWRDYQSSLAYAWLELLVAARTDPALRDEVQRLGTIYMVNFEIDLRNVISANGDAAELAPAAAALVSAVLIGMACLRIATPTDERSNLTLTAFKMAAKALGI